MRKKQWIALLLAVAMILSIGIPAYAEETGSANGGEVPSDGTSYSPEENTNDPLTEPVEETTEAPASEPAEETTEAPAAEPTEESTEAPAAEPAEAPAESGADAAAVQALIDALPDAEGITAENAETVAAQLSAIDEAKAALTDEQADGLNAEKYIAAAQALGAVYDAQTLADEPVAKIGEETYTTLAEAFTKAPENATVVLVENITGLTTDDIAMVPAGKTIVLDMNGKSITVDSSFVGRPIVNNGTLTITGNGIIDSSNSEFGGYGAVNNFGVLTIENGTFRGNVMADGSAVYVRPGGEATINGGLFEGCAAVNNAGKLTVNGGTFQTTSCNQTTDSTGGMNHWAYCVISSGELYFNYGTVEGVQGGLGINNGYAEVKGGKFQTVACEHSAAGAYSFYALYIAGEIGQVEALISGGEYRSASRVAVLCGNDNTGGDGGINAKATAYITGGTFIGGGSSPALQAGTNTGDPQITGGTFSSDVSDYVPDGYNHTGADGSYSVDKTTEQTDEHVAVVEGQYFKTVQGAIDAAPEGGTVTLLKDAETGNTKIDKSLTLDLGGHKLDLVETAGKSVGLNLYGNLQITNGTLNDKRTENTAKGGWFAVCVRAGAELSTVKVTVTSTCPAKSTNSYNYILRGEPGSQIHLNEGTVIQDQNPGSIDTWGSVGVAILGSKSAPSKLTVNGGKISTVGYAIAGNGNDHNTEITIEGNSEVTSSGTQAIFHPQDGTLNVKGGTITGVSGIEMRAGTLNVTGGEIIGTADEITVKANGSGSTTSGAGIAVAQHTTKLPVTVNVSGGQISGAAALYESNPQGNASPAIEQVEIHLTGGDFQATGTDAVFSQNKKNFISGGTYSSDVSEYVVEGNQALDDDKDGTFTINPDPKVAVAEVNGLGYKTVQEAVDAAAAKGGEVKLLRDANEDVVVSSGSVTIDLSGKTLTNDKSDTLTVKTGATLTVTGDGIVDNKTNGHAAIFNEGTVVLNGGTYDRTSEDGASAEVSGTNSWYTICNHGDMTINAGVTVKNKGSFSSMIENGYQSYKSGNVRTGYVAGANAKNPSLTINGGSFVGGLNTVKNDDGGVLKISGGEFSNTTQAAILNWNQAEITDGSFTVDTRHGVVLNGKDTTNTSGEGEVLNQGKLTISGGTFKAPEGVAPIGRMNGNADMSDVNVSGGTFSAEVPEEYCAEGFAPQKNQDGTFGVHTHENERVDAKEATCTEDGYTGDLKCAICGELAEKGEAIPATGHSYGTKWESDETGHWHECAACGDKAENAAHSCKWVVDKEATDTEAGSKHEECGVCGYRKAAVEIPATGTPVKPTEPDVPKTGDETNLAMMIAVMAASMLGIGVVAVLLTKKNYTGKYQK